MFNGKEKNRKSILASANSLRWEIGENFHDSLMESIYKDAAEISAKSVTVTGVNTKFNFEKTLDKLVTNRWTGFPLMFLMLAVVFWLTIEGANVPSAMLASVLVDSFHPVLKSFAESAGFPFWLNGVLIDGAYLAMAWVISVMLPPMAIFFPLFTLLEDFGYLPRVAFNMDSLYRKSGAHGKQALTMAMGFGCNAAGVIAGIVSAAAVVGIAVLGIALSLVVSWSLSKTVLKGTASAFSLELPPYRPPRIMQTLYTSLIDRTVFVLWRAVVFAIPAGVVIWLVGNIYIGQLSVAEHFVTWSNPFGILLGLNGVILLAYIIAIPANEIVIPTILMLTVLTSNLIGGAGAGVMFELESAEATADILYSGGWTVLTGVCLMLFSLLHNPCSTTLYTIYKETGSLKWTSVSALLPLLLGIIVCFFVAQIWRLFL